MGVLTQGTRCGGIHQCVRNKPSRFIWFSNGFLKALFKDRGDFRLQADFGARVGRTLGNEPTHRTALGRPTVDERPTAPRRPAAAVGYSRLAGL